MDVPSDSDKNEKIGYCSPPVHSRFRKGQGGNPKGRPRGTLNLATVLERTLRERVVINEYGKRRTVTKLEAAPKQLVNKAASGELRALHLLSVLVRSAEERGISESASAPDLNESDEKIYLEILDRLGRENRRGKDESEKT